MEFPPFEEIDETGLFHVARMFARRQAVYRGGRDDTEGTEWHLDKLALDLLGLGLEPGIKLLVGPVEKRAFLDAVEAGNGGALSPEKRAEANRLLEMARNEERGPAYSGEPVLSAAETAFFEENGYLVVRQAAEPEAVRAAAELVWEHLGASPEDPASWYLPHEDRQKVMVQLFRDPRLDATRYAPRIKQAFSQLWNLEVLMTSMDRTGFNPPETEAYPFPGPGIHWDTSLEPPVPFYLQGLLYLTDTAEEQGAFACVPGFHRESERWVESLPEGSDPRQAEWGERLKPVAAKAGDLVIFHHALPHGPTPNRGKSPRIVQYVNCYPPGFKDLRPWK